MTDPTARVTRRPDGQFDYELTITRGPYPTALEAGRASREEIVAEAEIAEWEKGRVPDDVTAFMRSVRGRALNDRELAAVLAGLRLYQRCIATSGFPDPRIGEIATDGGTLECLDEREVDALCERLNSGAG